MLPAEADHPRHAIIEQVPADLHQPTTRAPALGPLRREPGTAGPHPERVHPAPCRRRARLGVSRSSQHRNDPRPADQHGRTRRHVRPPNTAAPTGSMAVGTTMAAAIHRRGRTTYDCLTAVHRRKAQPEPSQKAEQTGSCHTPVTGPDKHEDQLDPATRSRVDPGLGILLRTRCAPPPSCIISPTIVADVFSSTTQKVVKLLVGTGGYSPPSGLCTSRRGNDTPAIRASASSERFALVRAQLSPTRREGSAATSVDRIAAPGRPTTSVWSSTPRPTRTADRKPGPVSGIRVITA